MTQPIHPMLAKLKCALGFHSCHTQSDDNYVWGECDQCHRRFGIVSRYALRCYAEIEAEKRKRYDPGRHADFHAGQGW